MQRGDVVVFDRHGVHHAVVLAVDPSGLAIIACTSVARDMDAVEVKPHTREASSLGWRADDNRVSYFYASGINVVQTSAVRPLLVHRSTAARRCHAGLMTRIVEKVTAWVLAGQVTGSVAAILAPSDPKPPAEPQR